MLQSHLYESEQGVELQRRHLKENIIGTLHQFRSSSAYVNKRRIQVELLLTACSSEICWRLQGGATNAAMKSDTLYVTGTERANKSGSYRNTSVEPVVCMQNTDDRTEQFIDDIIITYYLFSFTFLIYLLCTNALYFLLVLLTLFVLCE